MFERSEADGDHPEPTSGPAHAPAWRDPIAVALEYIETAIHDDLQTFGDGLLTQRVLASGHLVERARTLHALTAGAWEPRQTWLGSGNRSATRWLAQHSHTTTGDAQRTLRMGRLLAARAEVADRLRAEELTTTKVDALATVATADRADLFERDAEVLAATIVPLSPADAWTVLRRWACLADDELAGDEARDQHERRRLHHSQVGATWKTDGLFDADTGALIHAALHDAMDDPDQPDRPGGPRSAEQRRADAFTRIARHWLEHRNTSTGAPTAAVNLHLNAAALAATAEQAQPVPQPRPATPFDPTAICDLVPGGPVPRATAQRLLCDAAIAAIVLDDRGHPLHHGRHRRLFSGAQRRAMIARDGPTCVVPQCTTSVDQCHAHHLVPCTRDGPTDLPNGAHVCNSHHHDIHDRGFTLEPTDVAGRYTFTSPAGTIWTAPTNGWNAEAA